MENGSSWIFSLKWVGGECISKWEGPSPLRSFSKNIVSITAKTRNMILTCVFSHYNILYIVMRVSYGLVFFIAISMAGATFLLLTLSIRSIRNLVMSIAKKYRIGEGAVYSFIFWFCFTLVCAILIDAIWSYLSMKAVLQIGKTDHIT